MTLRSLIQKRHSKKVATAIPATFATQQGKEGGTVAGIATVAVANPSGAQAVPLTVTDETAIRSYLDQDDRRRCTECVNLSTAGTCLAANRGEIVAGKKYRPVVDVPRRCDGYASRPTPWIH